MAIKSQQLAVNNGPTATSILKADAYPHRSAIASWTDPPMTWESAVPRLVSDMSSAKCLSRGFQATHTSGRQIGPTARLMATPLVASRYPQWAIVARMPATIEPWITKRIGIIPQMTP